MPRLARLLALTSLLASCGAESPTSPDPTGAPMSRTVATAHYVFHFTEQDRVDEARQEAFHDWVLPQLGVSPGRQIQYFKYLDRTHMQLATGRATNGWADPAEFAVHSIFPWHAHEAVHVLTELLGRPSDFFNEGIAVALAFDPLDNRFVALWNNTPIHDVARRQRSAGSLVSPTTTLTSERFRTHSEEVSYPAAGSFVAFLIERYGQASLNEFFRRAAGRLEPEAEIRQRVVAVWGKSMETLEQEWLAFLQ
jgi:hypothetical protein